MFEIVFLSIVCIYFIQTILFSIGASKAYPKIKEAELPMATVIVAALDEEHNIMRCMEALNKTEYPEDKLEIIIVDGHSIDKTADIVKEYIKDKPKFKLIYVNPDTENLKGKANSIDTAVGVAKGDIILTTDADCAVSPLWVKTIASYYKDDVGMVNGYTSQETYDGFTGMQALDFIYLLTVAAGTINLGRPLSCIGNNMSYRKSAYLETGGYKKIPFSVTEDFQLLMAIHDLKKYKIIYPLDKDALVISEPNPTVKSLYHQKKRWGVGGLNSGISGFAVMGSAFIAHILMLLIPFFFTPVSLYLSLFKIGIDLFFLYPVLAELGLKDKLKYFVYFEIYFIIYVTVLPFIVLASRKVVWKRREY